MNNRRLVSPASAAYNVIKHCQRLDPWLQREGTVALFHGPGWGSLPAQSSSRAPVFGDTYERSRVQAAKALPTRAHPVWGDRAGADRGCGCPPVDPEEALARSS